MNTTRIFLLVFITCMYGAQVSAQQLVRQIGRLQIWRGENTRSHIYKPASVASHVDPLCSEQWDQYAPMNRFCPTIDADTCVTGCVANAMAELMYYYKYPEKGMGAVTYIDSLGCGDTLTADFSESLYDWANMLDDYSNGYTEEEADAAALLMKDCGYAVRMQYGTEASGAQVAWQPYALANYFGYDRGMQMIYRNFYSQTEWDSLMFTELDAGRPIVAGAWSRSMGHSFICDGYDERGYFHVHFGNPDGDADGWYYFTWLVPNQPLWHDTENPETGFNLLQSILVGAEPAKTDGTTERHTYAFGGITPLSDQSGLVVRNLANVGWNAHSGRVGLALKPVSASRITSSSDTRLIYTYSRSFELEEFEDTTYTDTILLSQLAFTSEALKELENSSSDTWKVVPVFEDNGTFEEARTQMGTPNYLLLNYENGTFQLSEPQQAMAKLQLSEVVFPDTIYQRTKPQFSFSVKNEGAEYSGRIYFALVNDNTPLTDHIFLTHGFSIGAGETLHREFSRSTVGLGVGTYYLRVMADVDLFTDSLVVLYEDFFHPIQIVKDTDTSIQNLRGDTEGNSTGSITYDLSGRPVTSPQSRRGILIREGRKILR